MERSIRISNEREFQRWLDLTLKQKRQQLAAEVATRAAAGKSEYSTYEESPGAGRRPEMNTTESAEIISRVCFRVFLGFVLLLAVSWQAPRAQAQVPVPISDAATPVALTTNNTGSAATYVLNSDSSISVLQNTGLVPGAGCGPILSGDTLSNAAIYFDSTTNRLYAVMEAQGSGGVGLGTLATYVTISGGTCTPGPVAKVSSISFANNELGVDPVQGNVYVVQATQGGSPDTLYILNIASFSTYTSTAAPPQVFLDYSASYGPIVIDSSTNRVYINDFGIQGDTFPGLVASPGFFVYDPKNSGTPSSNIQHVYGYVNSSGTNVPLNAQTLLTNNAGDLILVNQNISIANGAPTFQTSPFTILHTTATTFSFFTNTVAGPGGPSPSVYITPGASGISIISSANGASLLDYSATGAADIDPVHGVIYRFAYDATGSNASNISTVLDSGALLSYSLSAQKDTLLTANGLALANVYPSPKITPWSQMTFDPASNNLMLSASGALGVSNSLACSVVSVQQVLGGGSTDAILGNPAVNLSSAYIYDTQVVSQVTTLYYVAPPATCVTADLVLSPSVLPGGTAGQSYGPVNFSVTNGTTGTVTFSSPSTPPVPAGLTVSPSGVLSGIPTQVGTFEVTVAANDTGGDTGSETVPLTINCQTITAGPTPLPGAVVGLPYNLMFRQTGGIGSVTYQAFGPFPTGISFNSTSTGLTGTPTATGSFPIGIQVTDSNGCMSTNLVQTLTVSAPRFAMSPIPPNGSIQCPVAGPGFPLGVVPTGTLNGVSVYLVSVNIYNSGNVTANVNLNSATLDYFLPANPPVPGVPITFTSLAPGTCVSLTFDFPTALFTAPAPLSGFTLANIPQVLRLQGTYSATVGAPLSGNWSLTDRQVFLNSTICCTNGLGVLAGSTTQNNGYNGGPIGTGSSSGTTP